MKSNEPIMKTEFMLLFQMYLISLGWRKNYLSIRHIIVSSAGWAARSAAVIPISRGHVENKYGSNYTSGTRR